MRVLFGDDSFLIRQDGVPPHYHTDVRTYLDNGVAQGHWIGLRSPIEYPVRVRSPDLTPLLLMGLHQERDVQQETMHTKITVQ
ncbi:hypothetical protein TNCV_2274371 [Trichonephila clavipes]|nr:hypothetical protein TNCV_2274371 [Trichonephila clavipes]